MSTQVLAGATEWPEIEIARSEQFKLLDARAREIEETYRSTWIELADLCTTIRDNELWKEGNFHSFNAWLKDACPTSRSYAYMAIGAREELQDIPDEDLRQIPLGNAEILKATPRKQRSGKIKTGPLKGKTILDAAKQQTARELTATVIQEAPDAHLEQKICHKFRMTGSQSKKMQAGFDMWRILNDDPEAPAEDVLEAVVVDFMQRYQAEYEKAKKKR